MRAAILLAAHGQLDAVQAERAVMSLVGSLLPSVVFFFLGALLREERARVAVVDAKDRRDIVTLTRRAADLAAKTIADSKYPDETVLRVGLSSDPNAPYEAKYDLASEDDGDWKGESLGIVIVVEKAIAEQLDGLTIDAENGHFLFGRREIAGGDNGNGDCSVQQ
jgi:Fe-S cluster assembly iron-binding protein IscA